MKMPRVEMGRVQSLGENNVSAVGAKGRQAAATGKEQQGLMNMMADVAGDYIQRQQNVEYENAVAQSQIQINDFERQHLAKQYYTADELGNISEELVPRSTTEFVNGERVTIPRNDIPAYEAYPHLLKQQLAGQTEVTAEKISNPVLRKEYLRIASVKNSEMMMTAGIKAEQQQQEFVYNDGVRNAEQAFKSGNFVEGAFYVENLVTDDGTKTAMLEAGSIEVERFEVTEIGRSTDEEWILTTRSRYNDPNYDGGLNGKAVVADLDARLAELGLERIQDKEVAADILYSNRVVAAGNGNLTREDIEAGFKLYEIDQDNKNAVTPQERLSLLSVVDRYEADVQREADAAATEAEKAMTAAEEEAYDHYWKALNGGIDAGQVNYDFIENEYKQGRLKPRDEITARRRLDMVNNRNTDKANSSRLGSDVINGKVPPDRYDPKQQKGVDDYVEMNNITDPDVIENIIRETAIIPRPTQNMLNSSAMVGEGEEVLASLRLFGRLTDQQQYLVTDMGQEAKNVFYDATALIRGGVDEMKAMEIARENEALPREVKEQREREYRSEKYTAESNVKTLKKFMDDDEGIYGFDPGFWLESPPATVSQMSGEFENMVNVYYQRTGDIKRAQQMAWSGVKETWGAQTAGAVMTSEGKKNNVTRAAKYPLERTHGLTTAQANNAVGAFSEGHGFDPENVMITSDPITQRNGTYQVMLIDPETDEMSRPVYGPNHPKAGELLRFNARDWAVKGEGQLQSYSDAYGYSLKVQEELAEVESAEERRQQTSSGPIPGYTGQQIP